MKTTRKHLFPLRVLIPLALSGAWYAAFSQVTFAPAVNYTVGPPCSTACLAVADVNGDGKVGLVSANAGYLVNPDNTLSVLTNNGNGTFGYNATYTVGSGPHSVTAADVNGDGRVDLICANFNDNTLSVLTNDGNGGFGYRATYNVGALPSSVVAADVNGDGHLDLVCPNSGGPLVLASTLTVLTNNGSGGFGSNATYTVGYSASFCHDGRCQRGWSCRFDLRE